MIKKLFVALGFAFAFSFAALPAAAVATTVTISQGDNNVVLSFRAKLGSDYVNLTGATFAVKFIGPAGDVVSIPGGQVAADPDQTLTGNRGRFTITVLEDDSNAMGLGQNKDIAVTITFPDTTVITFKAKAYLNVEPADPEV